MIKRHIKRASAVLLTAVLLLGGCGSASADKGNAAADKANPEDFLIEGVVPITWEPSKDHLIIEGDEARELYTRIKNEDYPSLEELKKSPVISQIDSLSDYYIALYGKTIDIDTAERKKLREDVLEEFLNIGSARTDSTDPDTGRAHYVYDGSVNKDYEMELVLGLPASGKSTRVTDPDSEEMGAFILDCDVIKELIPEFQESHGGAADAVHMESMAIMEEAIKSFTEGDMKGTNVILPLVASDFDYLMNTYIKPFEDAGYNVRAKFVPCEENVSMARNVARELETGRIINSKVVFSFGSKPEEVYNKLSVMTNKKGLPYGIEEEEEQKKAA
ncbi:MAG: zeta toxin family protein [Lachnospiraceae bacterium]|nr:zeta toxin family protein [Lachnospiraceae bacterium]